MAIQIGTATAQPGQIVYGTIDAVPLPTGGADHFPVIIAQGYETSGPVLWLTANIHGNEYDGIGVIHDVVTPELPQILRGTVIAIPTLSPGGLRTGERSPYYLRGKDPNRLFPGLGETQYSNTTALEDAYARLFADIQATADLLLDLHDYGTRAIPFVFRDPVLYEHPRERTSAERLQQRVGEMLNALGLTVINEYVTEDYLKLNLHRSVSGSALNKARVPAVTIEIGGNRALNVANVRAVAAGVRNVMRWAGMLPGPRETLDGITVIRPEYEVRRMMHPRVPVACLVHPLVEPGDWVKAGQPVARITDIYGRPIGTDSGLLTSDYDGFVMGLFPGMAAYENDPFMGLAVRDAGEMVIELPKS